MRKKLTGVGLHPETVEKIDTVKEYFGFRSRNDTVKVMLAITGAFLRRIRDKREDLPLPDLPIMGAMGIIEDGQPSPPEEMKPESLESN